MIIKALTLAPALLLAGNAAFANVTVADAANWPLTPYICEGDEYLDVRFSPDGEYATIDQMDERILMASIPSASGEQFVAVHPDYSYELATKGNHATLYEAGGAVVLDDCFAGD
ncbi:MAG: MliC family protein [Paracoccus sp. (in: a-proteobacteria)]|nr:MliC family protein [Paracoccus sp. (in: a-proteobacteria)]